jgi:hypothetical protein
MCRNKRRFVTDFKLGIIRVLPFRDFDDEQTLTGMSPGREFMTAAETRGAGRTLHTSTNRPGGR